jgi:cell division protein FtsB
MGRRKKKQPQTQTLSLPQPQQITYSAVCIPADEHQRLLNENKELRQRVSNLEGERTRLNSELLDKIKSNEILKKENELLRKKIEELEARISNLETNEYILICGTILEQFRKKYIIEHRHVRGKEIYRYMNMDWYELFKEHENYALITSIVVPSRILVAHPDTTNINKKKIQETFSSILKQHTDIKDIYDELMGDVDVILKSVLG